ncbi:hypothetical protein A3193_18490 [Candidatus Thiodiazotropha endoloripes]|uniref:hypothetical protein n=1 Tax=Candidatus Thiodiazotropha endoloripes TaxID=1818881 RepID=UPI00083CFF93|nr:hypothetical protein [Candidatus Thiodiazotropha endoloripes]ODB82738.1 hypothetical protein A3193_18490 [Candidatus Thiodiazotropha endoloripes]
MKADQSIILSLITFFVGILFGSIFLTGYLEITPEAFYPALTTLVAAFLGAYTAYSLQNEKEKRKEERHNLTQANEVLQAIKDHIAILSIFNEQSIAPFRKHPYRYLAILPLGFELKPNLEIDVSKLSFLWQKGDVVATDKVCSAKFGFTMALDHINRRSQFYNSDIQPAFDSSDLRHDGKIDATKAKETLGERRYKKIVDHTNNMIDAVDTTIQSLFDARDELRTEINKMYPHGTAL